MTDDEFNVCCYGIVIIFLLVVVIIGYTETTATYVNGTQELMEKQIIHNNRYPDYHDVYRLYTNQTYDVSLEDYNSVKVGDNLTIGFSESNYRCKLYLNNNTYDMN